MKTKLFMLLLAACSVCAVCAQNKLTVVFDGIEKVQGHVMVALHDVDNNRVDAKMEKVASETVTIVFENLPAGDYAVIAFQDENDNKELDTGEYGIPKEKYGFSNNVRPKMGPPEFKDRLFKVEEDTEINITLIGGAE
jgi:uncharacterized protein (DUF2141 family)